MDNIEINVKNACNISLLNTEKLLNVDVHNMPRKDNDEAKALIQLSDFLILPTCVSRMFFSLSSVI